MKCEFLYFLFLCSLHVLAPIFEPAMSFGGGVLFHFVWEGSDFRFCFFNLSCFLTILIGSVR